MKNLTHYFTVAVIVADIFAVVYFGGMYLLTGSFLGTHTTHQENMVASNTPADKSVASKPTKDPDALPEGFIADASKGAKVAGKCKACHTFDQGGANRVGPNLWGVYNANIMVAAGFGYSSAFQDKADLVWNDEALNGYLKSPRKYIPGNKMAFAGLKKPEDRANLIEWLKTLN